MANPTLIQKQIKDNSEDLHNFVRDLKLWEEEMKRKDRQLSNDQNEEILPPVRRPKISKKAIPAEKQEKSTVAQKRIPSYDYKLWDKFDVDKACEEVDNDSENNDSEEDNGEASSEREEKYSKEKALYEKELGNKHVKASKWDDAIEAYTRAITAYSRDPVFFANRALCYLKKKKYDLVEADCTESLKLDMTYVKAYLRRAAAREALGRLEDARHDLRQALQLEPNNMQAHRDLSRLTASKNQNNTIKNIVTKEPVKEVKTAVSGSQKPEIQRTTPPMTCDESKDTIKISTSQTKKTSLNETSNEPNWQPCSNTIEAVTKPPHLRSKKSLKRIVIFDVGSNQPVHVCARNQAKSQALESKPEVAMVQAPSGSKPRCILTVNSPSSDVPPPPKTSVQFHTSWSSIKGDSHLCYKFLKQIPGEAFPDIFKESLESSMFSNIVKTLVTEFMVAGEPVSTYLIGLSNVRRFSTITLFMSSADKSNLSKLLEYSQSNKECSPEAIERLRRLYEIV